MSPMILIAVSAVILTFCDAIAAHWGKYGGWLPIVGLVVLAPIGFVFFGWLNSVKTLAVSSALVNLAVFLGGVLVSIVWFGESVTVKQASGIVLALVSLILLS